MKLRLITAVLGGLAATALSLQAQFVWTGFVSGSIENAANWSPTPSPITQLTNADLTFGDTSFSTILLDATAINSAFGVTNGTIVVNNVAFSSATAAYTFNGTGSPTLVINGNVSTTAANATPILLSSSIGFVFGNGGQHTFNIAGSSALGVQGNISGTSSSLVKTGAGILALGGVNTYDSGTTVNNGTLAVSGSITHGSANFIAGNLAGDNGTVVLAGGTVSSQTGYLGAQALSAGSMSVSGPGSAWTNSNYLYVGAQGTGILTVASGGAVNNPYVSVGNNTGGNGTVIVDGSGSTLNTTNTLYVGAQGIGTVTISNGADATNNTGSIGNNTGGNGTVTVDGAGSTWVNTAQLIVGDGTGSSGTLYVTNGGSVSTPIGTVAGLSASAGNASIDGANSVWNNSTSLRVGFGGIGSLTVSNGGSASVASGSGTLTLGSNSGGQGTLNLGAAAVGIAAPGGFIKASIITTGAGIGTVQFNTTATSLTPYYLTQDGTSGGAFISVTGPTKVVSTGGYNILPTGNTYSGGTTINGGTLIAGSSTALGSGAVTLNGGALGTVNGATVSNSITFTSGRLVGTGTFNSSILVGANAILAPGFSTGTLTFGSGLTLGQGGQLEFEVQTAASLTPGTGYDFVSVSGGSLDITSTSATPFKIKVLSLNVGGTPGNVSDFSSSTSYSWRFATGFAGLGGFTGANQFLVDATGFTNSLNGGTFSITLGTYTGNPALFLNFTPVPEPSTYALIAIGLGSLLLPVLRRRQRS